MSRLEDKNFELLKERFPCHKFTDKYDLELQQFTAEDLIDFAVYIAQASLEKASRIAKTFKSGNSGSYYDASIDKLSITQKSNIILL